MTNEQLFDDLKQFILATVTQATSGMATKDDISNMATKDDVADMATKNDIAELKSQINDMDLKISTIAEAHSELFDDHEIRLLRLESFKIA